jgi:hypothetical protein
MATKLLRPKRGADLIVRSNTSLAKIQTLAAFILVNNEAQKRQF